MRVKQGKYKGKILRNTYVSILTRGKSKDFFFSCSLLDFDIPLGNIISADVVSQENQSGGGVQGAAGGAVLGFLIAGPIGTVLGAGIGSKKKGRDLNTIALTFKNGDVWIAENPTPTELGHLKSAVARSQAMNKKKNNNQTSKETVKNFNSKGNKSIKKRLDELNVLFKDGYVDEDEYKDQRNRLLNTI